ncbi:hypothetical protein A3A45_02855 [Candidatus Daviesbacteria bacterium RIFCSPLOWO2_01_FULL_36_8]|nr:MAG: hypothetical protein A3A45_02855 [Candidatus Daviesbacteria bacterium RIFCSPLOWO2_01_FULL_36_8]
MKNLAMGATGLALAAGAVATGVALSKKKNRTKLVKEVKRASEKVADIKQSLQDAKERYQAYQHRIGLGKGKKKNAKGKK